METYVRQKYIGKNSQTVYTIYVANTNYTAGDKYISYKMMSS